MTATIVKFPVKVCAMCGAPATQSIDLVDEYGRDVGQKHLCEEYPYCTGPLSDRDTGGVRS